MEEQNRVIVLKLEVEEGKIVAIHALEIMNDIITGIFFHAYLNKYIKCFMFKHFFLLYKLKIKICVNTYLIINCHNYNSFRIINIIKIIREFNIF